MAVFKSMKNGPKAAFTGVLSLVLLFGLGAHAHASATTTRGIYSFSIDSSNNLTWVSTSSPVRIAFCSDLGICAGSTWFTGTSVSSPVVLGSDQSGSGGTTAFTGTEGQILTLVFTNAGGDGLSGVGDYYYPLEYESGVWTVLDSTSTSQNTRIVSFSPSDGATVTGPSVNISEHVYINPADLTGQLGIRLTLHNIDQNVLLLGFLSPSDITVFDGEATTSGDVFLGGNYNLADGNYRLNATLTRSYLYGWVINPFSSVDQDQSHQFVVGTSTFIGTLTQNGYTEFNSILASSTATSTAALASNCNPLTFSIVYCLSFLFLPGGPQLETTLVTFRDDVLQRAPWGYFFRAYNILSATSTAALPSFSTSFQIGPPDNLSTTSLSFDPGDMLAGAATLLTDTRDPQNGKNMRDVFEPFVQLTIALAVIFTIFADLSGSHKHHQDSITHR